MGYITAIEASRRIGVGERTVRLWIAQGKLKAEKVSVNRLAIDEREVDRIAKERSKYRSNGQNVYGYDISERLDELDRVVTELRKQVALLIDRVAAIEPRVVVPLEGNEKFKKVSVNSGMVYSDDSLPDGCVYTKDFARVHGVPDSSFRRHINSGIGSDKIEAEKSSKGRYLTHNQQKAALEFWARHGVKHV